MLSIGSESQRLPARVLSNERAKNYLENSTKVRSELPISFQENQSLTSLSKNEQIPKNRNLEAYSDGKSFQDLFLRSIKTDATNEPKKEISDPIRIIEQEKKEVLKTKINALDIRLHSERIKEEKRTPGTKEQLKDEAKAIAIGFERGQVEEQVRSIRVSEELKESFAILTNIRKAMVSNSFEAMKVSGSSRPGMIFNTLI